MLHIFRTPFPQNTSAGLRTKDRTEDPREDQRTQDSKKDPITEDSREDPITEVPEEDPITEDPRENLVTDDSREDPREDLVTEDPREDSTTEDPKGPIFSSFILNEKIELYEEETSASKWHEHVYMHEYIYIMHKYE